MVDKLLVRPTVPANWEIASAEFDNFANNLWICQVYRFTLAF
jgi:hypothetical protein